MRPAPPRGRGGGRREGGGRGDGPAAGPARRRPYRAPALVFFGDLRDLTLGGSPGVGDSGGGVLIQNPLP